MFYDRSRIYDYGRKTRIFDKIHVLRILSIKSKLKIKVKIKSWNFRKIPDGTSRFFVKKVVNF